MIKKKVFLFLFLLPALIFAQIGDDEQQNLLGNRTSPDTKTLQQYYQNLFRSKSQDFQSELVPAFDINKEELLKKLREAIPLDGPIDADVYTVGPGDIFELNIWGDIPFNFTIPVSPEGSLIIPTYGVIDVRNKTLTQVKQIVSEKLREKYLKGEISATLLSPRIFSVTVSGVVNNPGSYYAYAVQRVDQAIYMANLKVDMLSTELNQPGAAQTEALNRPEYIQYFDKGIEEEEGLQFSLRNIKVIRTSGDTIQVDLVRFYATGDKKYNPSMKDGDRIIVPNLDLHGNSITISGAVRLEGEYEYSDFDSIESIFDISQGPTKLADLDKVDLYRIDEITGKYSHEIINVNKILSGVENDVLLKPNDRVVIREKFPRPAPISVIVKGEVRKPGLYPIIKNTTTLTEIIDAAGGFTSLASLRESKVLRTPVNIDQAMTNRDYERLTDMRLSDMSRLEREYYNFESAIKRNFISVDFKDLFDGNDKTQDIYLEHGDIVIIPSEYNTVYVYGQVPRPGYVGYNETYEFMDYIRMAGGLTEVADEGDIRVIKAGSRNWMEPDDTKIEPGDTVWIPRETDLDFTYYFDWFARIIATLGGVATIILLLRAI